MCVPCWVFAQRTQQDLVFFCFLSAIPSQLWLVGGNAKKPSACNGPAHRALECAALLSCFCLSFSAYPRAALCWQINNFSNCSFNSLFSLCSTLELANFSIALPNISLCWKNPGHVENFPQQEICWYTELWKQDTVSPTWLLFNYGHVSEENLTHWTKINIQ